MAQSSLYLLNKLRKNAFLFIQHFDRNESQMRNIVREFQSISNEVKEMQEKTDAARKKGAVTGGIGTGAILGGLVLAPFTGGLTGGLSLAVAGVGAATVVGGGATVVGSNITKMWSESRRAEQVERWGEEFMKKVEPMKKNLEDIKMTCEDLEKKSAEAQAENTVTDVEELQRTLRRVSRLKEMSSGLLFETNILLAFVDGLVKLIKQIFRVTATPEEDQKLRDAIINSADQSQKIIEGFDKMRTELRKFTRNERK